MRYILSYQKKDTDPLETYIFYTLDDCIQCLVGLGSYDYYHIYSTKDLNFVSEGSYCV